MSKRNKQPTRRSEEPASPSPSNPAAKVWSVLIAIGSIGGFVSLAEKVWTIAITETKPDIRPLNLSADPFSLPFVIRNQSTVFTMSGVRWACGIDSGSLSDLSLLTYGAPTDILAGRSLLARCPAEAKDSDATIIPIVRYKTFGLPRFYFESSFTWLAKASPPQWIEGKTLR